MPTWECTRRREEIPHSRRVLSWHSNNIRTWSDALISKVLQVFPSLHHDNYRRYFTRTWRLHAQGMGQFMFYIIWRKIELSIDISRSWLTNRVQQWAVLSLSWDPPQARHQSLHSVSSALGVNYKVHWLTLRPGILIEKTIQKILCQLSPPPQMLHQTLLIPDHQPRQQNSQRHRNPLYLYHWLTQK